MNTSNQLKEEMIEVAGEVMRRSQVPSLRELALQLAMIEKRRQNIMNMLDWRADEAEELLDEDQYQLLMDFLLLQAAKKNIDSDDLVMELQYRFGTDNLRYIPVDKVWDALNFIKSYV